MVSLLRYTVTSRNTSAGASTTVSGTVHIDGPVEPTGHDHTEWSDELSYVSEYGGIWWNPDAEDG